MVEKLVLALKPEKGRKTLYGKASCPRKIIGKIFPDKLFLLFGKRVAAKAEVNRNRGEGLFLNSIKVRIHKLGNLIVKAVVPHKKKADNIYRYQ